MEPTDLTIEILKEIRDEVKSVRDEVKVTNGRIDLLHGELHEGLGTLTRRVVESEIRTSTAITELAGTVREMTGVLRSQADLRPRVERCERDIAELKKGA